MPDILDRFSVGTPITEDGKKAGAWFQRWISGLQNSIDPEWKTWQPSTGGGSPLVFRGLGYRDRGTTVDVEINSDVGISAAGTTRITYTAPIAVFGFGVLPGIFTQDFVHYSCLACYYDSASSSIIAQRYDGGAFALGTTNLAIFGSYRKL